MSDDQANLIIHLLRDIAGILVGMSDRQKELLESVIRLERELAILRAGNRRGWI